MTTEGCYIMRDQVRDLIPSLMQKKRSENRAVRDRLLYGLSVGTVTFVYLLAMAISST